MSPENSTENSIKRTKFVDDEIEDMNDDENGEGIKHSLEMPSLCERLIYIAAVFLFKGDLSKSTSATAKVCITMSPENSTENSIKRTKFVDDEIADMNDGESGEGIKHSLEMPSLCES
jgi:hypothetical protein